LGGEGLPNESSRGGSNMIMTELTGPERVLYKSMYQFAIDTLGLTPAEAVAKAMDKVHSKRALGRRKDIIKY
jgi:hypothetical protein